MIAKRIDRHKKVTSNYGKLAKYIFGVKSPEEKVIASRITNCMTEDDLDAAILEVCNTQKMNKRAKGDKTYHLVISFRSDEWPALNILNAVEDEVCATLGFSEHQRVSAIHADTDNLHIHVAINKINPQTLLLKEPYNDFHILGKACEELEKKFNLKHDNHQSNKSVSENKSHDMESHQGIESFTGYLKNELDGLIQDTKSWEQLHAILQERNILLAERGNGLVFVDQNSGVTVKASSVNRNLSKAKLINRFGEFKKSKYQKISKKRQVVSGYRKKPLIGTIDTNILYENYKKEQEVKRVTIKTQLLEQRRLKDETIKAALRAARESRAKAKTLKINKHQKRILYSNIKQSKDEKILAAKINFNSFRENLYQNNKRAAWLDWLKSLAENGNTDAIEILRKRQEKFKEEEKDYNTMAGQSGNYIKVPQKPIFVTKKGSLIYQNDERGIIKDVGKEIKISDNFNHSTINKALNIALTKYGHEIKLNGSEQFKAAVKEAAKNRNLKIRFFEQEKSEIKVAVKTKVRR